MVPSMKMIIAAIIRIMRNAAQNFNALAKLMSTVFLSLKSSAS